MKYENLYGSYWNKHFNLKIAKEILLETQCLKWKCIDSKILKHKIYALENQYLQKYAYKSFKFFKI